MSLTKSLKQRTHAELENQLVRIGETYPDDFWRTIIGNIAKNIFPKTGFNLYNSELSYGLGVRKEKVHLIGSDNEVALAIINFMRSVTSIYSPEEKVQLMEYAASVPEEIKKTTWTRFKLSDENKVNIKDYIKIKYTNVPMNMQTKIYNLIIYGLNTKLITEEMVQYHAGQIVNIAGIIESENNFRLEV